MGSSPDRLTPAQKDAIYDLKHKGKSGREVVALVGAGHAGLDPFTVSVAHANETYRLMAEQRGELYATQIGGLPTDGALDKLQARLLRLAEREIARQETRQRGGKLDAAQVGRLAGALERIHKLSEARAVPAPPTKGERDKQSDADGADADAVPSTFAEQLAEGEDAASAPDASAPAADVVLSPQGTVPGPKPGQSAAQAVPHDLHPTEGDGADGAASLSEQSTDGMSGGLSEATAFASHDQPSPAVA